MTRLHVCIDARIAPEGAAGGVQQAIQGMAFGFSRRAAGPELSFLTRRGDTGWLSPFLPTGSSLVDASSLDASGSWKIRNLFPDRIRRSRLYLRASSELRRPRRAPSIPSSAGLVEGLSPDVLHLAVPEGLRADVPTIYHVHDLQHVYLPEMFSGSELRARDLRFRMNCARADLVLVMTDRTRQDLVHHYGLALEKIRVVPWATPVHMNLLSSTTGSTPPPPAPFVLYPAATWPHKNHLRLLEAVALLRDERGLRVPLVCTGAINEHFLEIQHRIGELGLRDQVTFTGYVPPERMRLLYETARVLVFPSLFEGWGFPILEAFELGVPVASSDVTSLPRLCGEAALLFDPTDTMMMAEAIGDLWLDEGKRDRLVRQGRDRATAFSWDLTARLLETCYAEVAGESPSEQDLRLMTEAPLV